MVFLPELVASMCKLVVATSFCCDSCEGQSSILLKEFNFSNIGLLSIVFYNNLMTIWNLGHG